MANTRKVLLSLHNEVADALATEKAKGNNMSAVADAVLAAHYGLSFDGSSAASIARQSMLDSFKAGSTTEVKNEAEVVNDTVVPLVNPGLSSIVQDNTPVVPSPVVEPLVAPQRGEAQPASSTLVDEFVPMVQPLESVEPASEVQPAETPEEPLTPTEEVEPEPELEPEPEVVPTPVTTLVEPGVQLCPTCGEPKVTPICLNCL